jgi:hypothetical protein
MATPQPSPSIAEGGDCGPCCLSGALGLSVVDVYAALDQKSLIHICPECREGSITKRPDRPYSLDLRQMRMWMKQLEFDGKIDSYVEDPVLPMPTRFEMFGAATPWGYPADLLESAWIRRVRTYLEAGFVGITTILYSGGGMHPSGLQYRSTSGNHWVLITGMRGTAPNDAGTEVKISCSVRGDKWTKTLHFLNQYGGFEVMFIRPKLKI